jgi:hypothetical protein
VELSSPLKNKSKQMVIYQILLFHVRKMNTRSIAIGHPFTEQTEQATRNKISLLQYICGAALRTRNKNQVSVL